MIALTCDIDWAPDEVIEFFLSIVNDFSVKVTFFCTHRVNIEGGHELAVHPNYKPEKSYEEALKKLLNLFPTAKGVRNHSLYFSGRIVPILSKYKIQYISNCMMYKQSMIRPFLVSKDLLQLPIYFMDDVHMHFDGGFQLDDLNLSQPGLKVFAFHPVHIFLNTNSLNLYETAKKYYHQPKELENYRKQDSGTKDLFMELLNYIHENNNIQTYTLGEINSLWRKNKLKLKDLGRNCDKRSF